MKEEERHFQIQENLKWFVDSLLGTNSCLLEKSHLKEILSLEPKMKATLNN